MSWVLIIYVASHAILYGPYASETSCKREALTHHTRNWRCFRLDGMGMVRPMEWGTIPDPNEAWLLRLNKEKLPQLSREEYEACKKWWDRRGGTDEIWRVCGLPPPRWPLGPN